MPDVAPAAESRLSTAVLNGIAPRPKRTMSPAARAKISAAQRARHAAERASDTPYAYKRKAAPKAARRRTVAAEATPRVVRRRKPRKAKVARRSAARLPRQAERTRRPRPKRAYRPRTPKLALPSSAPDHGTPSDLHVGYVLGFVEAFIKDYAARVGVASGALAARVAVAFSA